MWLPSTVFNSAVVYKNIFQKSMFSLEKCNMLTPKFCDQEEKKILLYFSFDFKGDFS